MNTDIPRVSANADIPAEVSERRQDAKQVLRDYSWPAMRNAIQRVRDLHKPEPYTSPGCSDGCCGDGEQFDICRHCRTQYPCETIEALDGEQG